MRFRLLVVALGLAAQTAWGASLGDIYRLALDNDPQYASAHAASQAGHEKEPQARAGLLPSLLFSAFLRQTNVDSNKFPGTDYLSPGLTLALTQPLYRKQNREFYSQGQLQTRLADEQLLAAEQDLVLRSAKAYFDVLLAQDVLSDVQSQKIALAEQLAQAKMSFEVGTATITDTHEAQARYDLTAAQEIAATNDLDVKRAALETLIGRRAPTLARLQDKVVMPQPSPNNLQDWMQRAEDEGVPVQLARTGLEIASHEIERRRGGHLPTLDLAASYNDIHNQSASSALGVLSGVDTRTGVIGLEFNWPLYQGGLVDSQVREAVANREKARYDLDNARRQATLDARQGYLGVVSGGAQVKALEQALVSTELQLSSTKLGLEVGVRTRVDVLNAEQQIYSTQRDLSSARYQTLLAMLQLKSAVGTLAEADLKAIDALLRE